MGKSKYFSDTTGFCDQKNLQSAEREFAFWEGECFLSLTEIGNFPIITEARMKKGGGRDADIPVSFLHE